jgi:type II secretion system protein J
MRRNAFTLIEVLLAVAIFGVVLLAIHSIFHGALRLRNRTTQAVEEALPIERALATLRHDLANIVPPDGPLGGTLTTTATTTDGLLTQPLLQFHTATGILTDTAPWGEIQRVAYSLAAPTNTATGRDLRRIVTRNLLPLTQDLPDDQPLLQGVDSILFSFHDGTAWKDSWDSTNEVILLPRAIRVSLTLVDTNLNRTASRPPPIELVVGLMVEPATNSTTTASTGGGA